MMRRYLDGFLPPSAEEKTEKDLREIATLTKSLERLARIKRYENGKNEAAAFEHVEAVFWADGAVCPYCGNCGKIYDLKGTRVWNHKNKVLSLVDCASGLQAWDERRLSTLWETTSSLLCGKM